MKEQVNRPFEHLLLIPFVVIENDTALGRF